MKGRKSFHRRLNLATGEYESVARFFIDGNEVSEAEFNVEFPEQPIVVGEPYRPTQFKPIASEACAVHPKQRQKAIELAAKQGVPTEFNSMGQPIFRSRQHRRAFLRAKGLIDRSSFSGY